MRHDVLAVPRYLSQAYWWAYVHPNAVRLFERQWLVNLILWGNFARLRDAALDALGPRLEGRTLQIACVYGDLTERLRARLAPAASLDVADVLRVQLDNLARKLRGDPRVGLIQTDSAALELPDASYDRALLFFLLHEQPAEVRRRTIAEALRVVKPGGRLVIVDYHRPHRLNPLYGPMTLVLRLLEPYALDLWRHQLGAWLPPRCGALRKRTLFGGLYQLVTLTVPQGDTP
ncbi:MAG TPA: rhodoquinone biosynthesis methyltransferase RquA [Burkholderiales bacterium]|nr:rhodoquinone biosynthesis methyltransferase RquA [Steroidobacteraceae bacterium]HEU4441337.1 rhodoquinone biosynthesis methyltransferase RquA [Burkholderiales bacterium]